MLCPSITAKQLKTIFEQFFHIVLYEEDYCNQCYYSGENKDPR